MLGHNANGCSSQPNLKPFQEYHQNQWKYQAFCSVSVVNFHQHVFLLNNVLDRPHCADRICSLYILSALRKILTAKKNNLKIYLISFFRYLIKYFFIDSIF